MEYLIKSTAVIILFYMIYKLLLQRDTFFENSRWFLILGILGAFVIPFIIIPIYITVEPQNTHNHITGNFIFNESTSNTIESSYNWSQLLTSIYFLGVVIFSIRLCIQFFSLTSLLYRHKKYRSGKFIFVEVNDNISPFSFFNWIVFNPEQFKKEELDQIITHEKVHASQYHSIDLLLIQITSVLLWFNPFIWFYEKAMQQNLEFIADSETQKLTYCRKSYQQLLLKTSVPNHQMAFANNFFNSLIKKRIVMLHKSKSRKRNQWKYLTIFPLLAFFLMSFNTKKVYIEADTKNERFTISAETTNKDLKSIENALSATNLKLKFTDLIRNEDGDIQRISINTKYEEDRRFIKRMTLNNDLKVEKIEPFNLSLNKKDNTIDFSFIGKDQTSHISDNKISFSGENSITTITSPKSILGSSLNLGDLDVAIISKSMSKSDLEEIKSNFKEKGVTINFSNIKRNSDNEITAISISASSKTSRAKLEVDSDKPIAHIVIKYDSEEETISLQNTSSDSSGMHFISSDTKHKITTHGKSSNVFTFSDSDDDEIIIETNGKKRKIKTLGGSVHIISDDDEEVIDLDGDDEHTVITKSKDGKTIKKTVVKNTWVSDDDDTVITLGNNANKNVFISASGDKNPLIILDGKEITLEEFKDLDSDKIKTVNVVKGEKAKEEFGDKGKDGVIKITTKD